MPCCCELHHHYWHHWDWPEVYPPYPGLRPLSLRDASVGALAAGRPGNAHAWAMR